MAIDYTIRSTYLNVIQVGFCSFCAIFLLILIRPLYNFSKERTALFILFSKSCANIIYQFLQIYTNLYRNFPSFSSSFWSYFFISPIATILSFSIYIHIIALALNRFHSVFFMLSYQNKWTKR
ncbi:hypothetical protein Mgra_00003874 [Meloidogyne graminicola]|uniref:Serpentine receptor class gamma n=1 Tax=Meloidogyne graminicola TaxID=189291 RepID=A0A8S9ZT85_9BILA|nr:hypothetical protein Mgra_00003874 [Meloidogyne graminicola]